MRFTKMHGIGNDFIVMDAIKNAIENPGALAKQLCSRRFSIGADGLILICESDIADAKMRIFNSDGSEAEMCGNGIRCAAKYIFDERIVPEDEFTIETLDGVKTVYLVTEDGKAVSVTVNMGSPCFDPAKIPVDAPANEVDIEIDGFKMHFFCVNMGVPHAVTFSLMPERRDFLRLGEILERHPLFPAKTNVEFCRVDDRENVKVLVWERGAGETLACGTGSCSVLAAGHTLGFIERRANIHLPGGTLDDRWAEDGNIYMTGPAETVFEGEIEV